MSKGLEGGDKKGEGKIEIASSVLLSELFAMQKGAEGHEYEVERRFKPARILSDQELLELSKNHHLDIEQAYIFASTSDGEKKTSRLRRTSSKAEDTLLRIAHKAKTKTNTAARDEYQIKFPTDDERAQEFERLWKQHVWEVLRKTRYYIEHTLPNGSSCEIHYDVHSSRRLDGFVRIEVEFKSDADEAYVRDWKGVGSLLPDWIGKDVTNDKRYGSKALCKDGNPEGSNEIDGANMHR